MQEDPKGLDRCPFCGILPQPHGDSGIKVIHPQAGQCPLEGEVFFITDWSRRASPVEGPADLREALERISKTARGRKDSDLPIEHRECLEIARAALVGAGSGASLGAPRAWLKEKIRIASKAGEITGIAESLSWFLENDSEYSTDDAVAHLNTIVKLSKSMYEPGEAAPAERVSPAGTNAPNRMGEE